MERTAITRASLPVRSLRPALSLEQAVGCYLELGKARLATLVVATTAVGFVLGSRGVMNWERFSWALAGTGLTALGANIWNQWMERGRDARMERTRGRPLPSGRVQPDMAALWGTLSVFWGVLFLAVGTNFLTAGLALLTEVLYLFVYTPLKARSPICTLAGAVCGAIPPMMGWTAATGGIGPGAWLLGAVLFTWQIPHFLALAWLYRDDYARGGFRMLPILDRGGRLTGLMAVLYSLALVPLGLLATLLGVVGWTAAFASVGLGIFLLVMAIRLDRERSAQSARKLFLASLVYLPLLLTFMVLDRARGPHIGPTPAEAAVSRDDAQGDGDQRRW